MFEEIIIEQNPHWAGALYKPGIKRSCFPKFLDYLKTGMIVSITGVRRAGKSTLLKQMINHLIQQKNVQPQNIFFMNLEHPYLVSYSNDVGYLQKIYEEYLKIADPTGEVYVLFDEVQFFKDWPVFVKALYEQKKVQFVLTGSNSVLLSSDLITLLSGRTLPLEVFPLSFTEIAQAKNIVVDDLLQVMKHRIKLQGLVDQFLKYGGFPEVVLRDISSVAYEVLTAYAKTILYQDVAPRLQLRKSIELERLFTYLISNIGKPFSYSNLSNLFDLTDKVIKEYIAAFGDSYLLFELEMFDYSLKKQLRSQKKIYSIDTGTVNAVAFRFTENLGRLFENFVFLELRRIGLEMYYYKTDNNLEIDFLVKRQLRLALVQVAWSIQDPQTRQREIKALVQGLDELKLDGGVIITQDHDEQLIEGDKNITIMPAYKFFCFSDTQKLDLLRLS